MVVCAGETGLWALLSGGCVSQQESSHTPTAPRALRKMFQATVTETLAFEFCADLSGASCVESENSAGSLCLYR